MKKLSQLVIVTMAFTGLSAIAAVEDNEVRGEVVSVNSSESRLQIRVTEAGDSRNVTVGSIESFDVPDDAEFEYQIDRVLYRYGFGDGLEDLSSGDSVLLRFEESNGERQAVNVRNEEPNDPQVRDRVRRQGSMVADADDDNNTDTTAAASGSSDSSNNRTTLPSSASAWPMLALLGFFFGVIGTALRRLRKSA